MKWIYDHRSKFGHVFICATSQMKMPAKSEGVLTLREITWLAIQDAIERNDGNCSKAARELGIGRTKIYRWIKEMNRGPFKERQDHQ